MGHAYHSKTIDDLTAWSRWQSAPSSGISAETEAPAPYKGIEHVEEKGTEEDARLRY